MTRSHALPLEPPSEGVRIPILAALLFFGLFFFAHPHDLSWCVTGIFGAEKLEMAEEFVQDVEQGSRSRQAAIIGIGATGAMLLARYSRHSIRPRGLLGWLVVCFLVWAAFSVMWSEDTSLTVRRLVVLIMLSLGALGVAASFSFRELTWLTFLCTGMLVFMALCAEIAAGCFQPSLPWYRFAGTIHPNQQADNCVFLFFSSLILAQTERRSRVLFVVAATLAFVFLLLTKSRTALVSAAVALSLYSLVYIPFWSKVFTLVLVSWALCLSFLVLGQNASRLYSRAALLGRSSTGITTLTGRTVLWEECIGYALQRPVLGYGYGSFWNPERVLVVSRSQDWNVAHAHNDYAEMLLNTGLVGALMFTGVIILTCLLVLSSFAETRDAERGCAVLMMITMATLMLLECRLTNPWFPPFLCLVVIAKFAACENEPARVFGGESAPIREAVYGV